MRGTLQQLLFTCFVLLFLAPVLSIGQSLSDGDISNSTDIETPQIVINEFLADPVDDANDDGLTDKNDDAFIEIVNIGDDNVNISGWQIFDSMNEGQGTLQYTFPSGTILQAKQAVVVFGGGNPVGFFGGALVQTANGLSMNNNGDSPALFTTEGTLIAFVSYGESGQPKVDEGQSLTRVPDITGNFTLHSQASGSGGALFTPGTRVDGTAFGSTFAMSFRGGEGFRFIGTPSQNTSFDDLLAGLWTQGIPGSDIPSAAANLFGWQEAGGGVFSPVSGMSTDLSPGKGYIIYVYEDEQLNTPGLQGGFPKVISSGNAENPSPIRVFVSADDTDGSGHINANEGFNLLSNPYGTNISVAAVVEALEAVDAAAVNTNLLIWDHQAGNGNGGFIDLTEGDVIAPFQAFFVRYTDQFSGNVNFDRDELAAKNGAQFNGRSTETEPTADFEMYFSDGNKFDTYQIKFKEDGTVGEDRLDAYKLFSLNDDALNFYSEVGEENKLSKNVLPSFELLQGERELRIPLVYNVPQSGEYTISWSDLQKIPRQFELYLVDNQTGRNIDMKVQEQHQFSVREKAAEQAKKGNLSPSLSAPNSQKNNTRFELLLVSSTQKEEVEESLEQAVVLSTNYPNPFYSQTTMDLQLREKMHVNVTVWNIVGQKVATMVDKTMDAGGPYNMTWNVPASMPSGIYICKVEAGGMVLTRKMTLLK